MTNSKKHTQECGPFIACGAACVSFSDDPAQPTSFDHAAAAIKRFFKGERRAERAAAPRNAHSDKPAAVIQGL